jgi:hypothetical protein
MTISKDKLLSMCVSEMPTKQFKLSNSEEVTIKALDGLVMASIMSEKDVGEQIFLTLKNGLVEPSLNNKELRHFINKALEISTDIYSAILDLSNVVSEIEIKSKEEIKKN